MAQLTLSNGQTITVYPVPPFALMAVEARYPDPPPPDVEADTDSQAWRDWYARQQAIVEERDQARSDAALLIAFRDVEVPEGWRFPAYLTRAGLSERPGEDGRLLDYVRYVLLESGADIRAIKAVMYGRLTEQEVEASADTFRDQG